MLSIYACFIYYIYIVHPEYLNQSANIYVLYSNDPLLIQMMKYQF